MGSSLFFNLQLSLTSIHDFAKASYRPWVLLFIYFEYWDSYMNKLPVLTKEPVTTDHSFKFVYIDPDLESRVNAILVKLCYIYPIIFNHPYTAQTQAVT